MKQKWFGAKYIGGHSEVRQKMGGPITLANDSLVFQSANACMKCPQSGEVYSSKKGFDFCPTCGVKLESA